MSVGGLGGLGHRVLRGQRAGQPRRAARRGRGHAQAAPQEGAAGDTQGDA